MKSWYGRSYILYEILFNNLFDRETACMIPNHRKQPRKQSMYRYNKIFTPQGITFTLFQSINCIEEGFPLQLYHSLATYKTGLPQFSGTRFMWKNETDKWNENKHQEMIAYDLQIDIDCPDTDPPRQYAEETKSDAIKVSKLLDSCGMPYYLRYTGKGYHFIIPHRYFACLGHHFHPHDNQESSVYTYCDKVTSALNETISEFIDTGLHDSTRITKNPYSLVFYPEGIYVCWPFKTKQEFYSHNVNDYKLNSGLGFPGEQKMFRRGQTLFNQDEWSLKGLLKLNEILKIKGEENARNDVER